MKREYFDADLKNQGKPIMQRFTAAMEAFGGIEHDRHESRYFSGKQTWRNPLFLRISLPEGKRWEFISQSRIWLAKPPRIGIPEWSEPPKMKLQGNHEQHTLKVRRSYNLHFGPGWVKNFHADGSYTLYEGAEWAARVLDGELEEMLH